MWGRCMKGSEFGEEVGKVRKEMKRGGKGGKVGKGRREG